jgi:ectoine hydroxylase-related dioxygenase (phytanoyl-CoA dioxygenase family)
MNTPWVESPFFKEILDSKNLTEKNKQLAIDYNENGFVVIPNLISESEIDAIKSDMDNKGYNPEFKMENQRDHVRIQDLWMYSESTKNVACNTEIASILEMLYEREPIPFQTLNFRVGSQQRAHSDTIHFSSIPAKFMCGVWVALEDITPENGAVFYYPKSQNLPEYNFSHFKSSPVDTAYSDYIEYEDFIEKIVEVHQFEKKPFYAKKGDVLIWSSNIIHGGSKVLNEQASRYSMVTHYYFKDCIYYTPMLSNMVTNELFLRNNLVDIKTGKKVVQSFNGTPINSFKTATDKFILNDRLVNSSEFYPPTKKSKLGQLLSSLYSRKS